MTERVARRQRFRVSLRALLIGVAVAGMLLGVCKRALRLEELARVHDQRADDARDHYYFRHPVNQLQQLGPTEGKRRLAGYRALRRWHRGKATELRRAIWRPWFRVEPDEPPPPDPEPYLPRRKYRCGLRGTLC